MTEKILRDAGYRTGLFPSPFIEVFNERIQICGKNISDNDLAEIITEVKEAADKMEERPTHFELCTAAGLLYFARQKCDIVVLEVGLGGRMDATNVIDAPEVAAICNIGLDHTDWLGDTVEKIAAEKCGIIKPGSYVVTYPNVPGVLEIIEKKCQECGDKLYYASEIDAEFTCSTADDEIKSSSSADEETNPAVAMNGETKLSASMDDGVKPAFASSDSCTRKYRLSLYGEHQRSNAKVVLQIIHALRDRGWKIPEEAVRSGLATTVWPARFEFLNKSIGKISPDKEQEFNHTVSETSASRSAERSGNSPAFILDGGHNPQCAQAMTEALREYAKGNKVTFIMGMLADKDYQETIDIILPYAAEFFTLTPKSPRALSGEELAETIRKKIRANAAPTEGQNAASKKCKTIFSENPATLSETISVSENPATFSETLSVNVAGSYEDAIRKAIATGRTVVAFGSLYMAGELRSTYRKLYESVEG